MCRCAARQRHGGIRVAGWEACRAGSAHACAALEGRARLRRSARMLRCALAAGVLLAGVALAPHAFAVDAAASESSAEAIAQSDPRVAAVLAGLEYTVSSSAWGGGDAGPAGATLIYSWPAAAARGAEGVWPLLSTTGTEPPAPPHDPVERRVRLDDLTSLRVDVLSDARSVVQIRPLVGETEFVLIEETWPPFSWFPWFTENPWVLAPLYALLALWIISRAWRRSRAWNRRLPSMTRHDRQFLLRLSVVLFLLVSIAWQVYESFVAARSPSASPGGMNAGDLAALPILLFPPALFFAALALEFSPGAHRVAWGLVAILAGAGSVYFLMSAMIGTAGNLNLSYYILLGALALFTAPRAFSAGRMGWSRKGMPRYA